MYICLVQLLVKLFSFLYFIMFLLPLWWIKINNKQHQYVVGPEPDHDRALTNLKHYKEMIIREEEELQRARQVVNPNPLLKNDRVLDGVRATPDFHDYERLCRGEQLPRQVRLLMFL